MVSDAVSEVNDEVSKVIEEAVRTGERMPLMSALPDGTR